MLFLIRPSTRDAGERPSGVHADEIRAGRGRPCPEPSARPGLRRIIIAWMFGSVFFNVTAGAPLAAYVRRLGADDFVWGVICAAPMVGSVSQILTSFVIERTRRRKPVFMACGLTHRLLWLPIAALPWLSPPGHRATVVLLAALAVSASVSGQGLSPAFMSWMADFVPIQVRGSFFSTRMRIGTAVALVSSAAAGLALDLWPHLATYSLLFGVASICGALDILQFLRVPEPAMPTEEAPIPVREMMRAPFGDPIFRRFLAFAAANAFSASLMAPFLWPFTMERLGMGKLATNMTLMGAQLAAVSLVSPLWGRLIDRFGNRPVLHVCMAAVTLTPVAWIVAGPAAAAWMWAVVFVTGSFTAGVDLTNFNLMLSLFPRERQSVYLALFSLPVGLVAGIAPMLGGALADYFRLFPPLHIGNWTLGAYRMIFGISLVCRILTTALLLPRVQEPRAGSTRAMLRVLASDMERKLRTGRRRSP